MTGGTAPHDLQRLLLPETAEESPGHLAPPPRRGRSAAAALAWLSAFSSARMPAISYALMACTCGIGGAVGRQYCQKKELRSAWRGRAPWLLRERPGRRRAAAGAGGARHDVTHRERRKALAQALAGEEGGDRKDRGERI